MFLFNAMNDNDMPQKSPLLSKTSCQDPKCSLFGPYHMEKCLNMSNEQ